MGGGGSGGGGGGGGGKVCVCVGKGLDLEELSGGAEGWRGAENKLGELFNRPLKQGLLTLLTMLPQASPGSLSTRGTTHTHTHTDTHTHSVAPGNLTLSN